MLMKSTTQKNLTHSMKKSKLKILTIVNKTRNNKTFCDNKKIKSTV